MDKKGSEADVIFNRASVALAKSQRLIASWLPPKSEEERRNEKTEEEKEREEQEIFTPVPELLGVGAPIPKDVNDSTLKRRELSSNDKLLQQLIGKKAARAHMAAKQQAGKQNPSAPNSGIKFDKPVPKKEESEDEEEGRAAAFKSKKKRKVITIVPEQQESQEVDSDGANRATHPAVTTEEKTSEIAGDRKRPKPSKDNDSESDAESRPRTKPKSGSYLDEILAQRSKKKKNKKNKV